MIREFTKSQTKKSQPLRCSAHPATLHIQLFFFEKLAILKSVLKCSAGNSASVHFFVQGSGRTRQHLALGLTNARLLSYQLNTAREEQEHSSTLAERLLKNMVWVGGKAPSGGLLADTPSPMYKRPHIQLKLDPPVHSVLNGIHKILLVSAFEFVLGSSSVRVLSPNCSGLDLCLGPEHHIPVLHCLLDQRSVSAVTIVPRRS